jgi:hypothetical protein
VGGRSDARRCDEACVSDASGESACFPVTLCCHASVVIAGSNGCVGAHLRIWEEQHRSRILMDKQGAYAPVGLLGPIAADTDLMCMKAFAEALVG